MASFLKLKPFYKNKTREDFIEWFSNAKHWDKLNSKIIGAIIDKFIDDLPAFECFVYISESCNLVLNNYVSLSEKPSEDVDFLLSTFALTIYNTGGLFRDELLEQMNQDSQNVKALSRSLEMSQLSFESAIMLNEFCFGAYYQLAFLRGEILKKYGQGIDYCKRGLEKIEKLESMKKSELTLMQRSTLDTIGNSKELFDTALREFNEKI